MTSLKHPADDWNAEAAKCEAAAKRYAARGMDEEVAFFTAKARDCRELAETYRRVERDGRAVPMLAAE